MEHQTGLGKDSLQIGTSKADLLRNADRPILLKDGASGHWLLSSFVYPGPISNRQAGSPQAVHATSRARHPGPASAP